MSNYTDHIQTIPGLISYWPMDDASSSTVAVDIVGGFDASAEESPVFQNSPAIQTGTSVDLRNGYLEAPHTSAHNPSAITLEFWARIEPGAISGFQGVIGKPQANSWGFGYGVVTEGSNYFWFVEGFSSNFVKIIPSDIEDDVWHHFVLTYDQSLLKVYIDNALYGSADAPASYTAATTPFQIGDIAFNWPFPAKFDDVALYGRALTEVEIDQNWQVGTTGSLIQFKVAGNVKVDGSPFDMTVRAHRYSDGALVKTTTSDPTTGDYTIEDLQSDDPLLVVEYPASGSGVRPKAHGPITPVEQ